MFCLAATAALVLSVQERANSRGRSPDPSSWRGDDAVRALIGRWFSTLGAGPADGQDMLLDNAATPWKSAKFVCIRCPHVDNEHVVFTPACCRA